MIPYIHITFALKIYSNRHFLLKNFSILSLICITIGHHLSAIGFWLYFFNLSHSFTLLSTLCATLIKIFFIKMQQNYLLLRKLTQTKHLKGYVWIRTKYIETYVFFFAINQMYGKLILSYLFCFLPINLLMTMWLIHGFVELENNFFMTFFVAYQMVFIFVIHLSLTYCTKIFHKPAKMFIQIMVHSQHQVGHTLARCRLANDICAFHTKNRFVNNCQLSFSIVPSRESCNHIAAKYPQY